MVPMFIPARSIPGEITLPYLALPRAPWSSLPDSTSNGEYLGHAGRLG